MITNSIENDDIYRSINYRICTSIDLCKLGVVLDDMVDQGLLDKIEARSFSVQAAALLSTIRQANDRAFGKPLSSLIG
jgi:hypothetical protein